MSLAPSPHEIVERGCFPTAGTGPTFEILDGNKGFPAMIDLNELLRILREAFDYLLAILVILSIVNYAPFLPRLDLSLLPLALATIIVGAIGYSGELWSTVRGN